MHPRFNKLVEILTDAGGSMPGRDLWDELEMSLADASDLVRAAEREGLVEWAIGDKLTLREQRKAVKVYDTAEITPSASSPTPKGQ